MFLISSHLQNFDAQDNSVENFSSSNLSSRGGFDEEV